MSALRSASPWLRSDRLDPFTLGLLTNDEVLEINQDPLCQQATCIARSGVGNVYAKRLENGAWAVGLFNRGNKPLPIVVRLVGSRNFKTAGGARFVATKGSRKFPRTVCHGRSARCCSSGLAPESLVAILRANNDNRALFVPIVHPAEIAESVARRPPLKARGA